MLIPVNMENKLLYKEILVYNVLVIVCVHLIQIIRNIYATDFPHTILSSSQTFGNYLTKNKKQLTIFGLWKHTISLFCDAN
uniref:Uncharacterized protein n=1 Tax=Trichobilharzia regenti TaxID=157069 RepID=A0AA85J468_TRIRE